MLFYCEDLPRHKDAERGHHKDVFMLQQVARKVNSILQKV
jgi:hypothetical protein